MTRTDVRAFTALHQWRLLDPSLTRERVQARIDLCLSRTSGVAAGRRLLAILDWADQFDWEGNS